MYTVNENAIAMQLKSNPDTMHVTADGMRIYLLSEGDLMCISAPDGMLFNDMNDDRLNTFVQNYFIDLMSV